MSSDLAAVRQMVADTQRDCARTRLQMKAMEVCVAGLRKYSPGSKTLVSATIAAIEHAKRTIASDTELLEDLEGLLKRAEATHGS